ncbi:MAG TPA: hypothetical protein VJP08_04230 [Actinomycetota bacterium]|nr:hypothetical protein [Actinomycetota bacterium]
MSEIEVTPQGGGAFLVTVTGPPRTTHRVTIPAGMLEDLGGATPEAVVRESFAFLLEREPNTSILADFSLDVIERYFPEYGQELARRLA